MLAILSLPPIHIIISNISGMVSNTNIRIEIPLEILTALTLLIIGQPPITALAETTLLAIGLKINKKLIKNRNWCPGWDLISGSMG
ncbi:MAG: hypothetical protein ACP5GY_09050 [Vulcanisaeta sp.]